MWRMIGLIVILMKQSSLIYGQTPSRIDPLEKFCADNNFQYSETDYRCFGALMTPTTWDQAWTSCNNVPGIPANYMGALARINSPKSAEAVRRINAENGHYYWLAARRKKFYLGTADVKSRYLDGWYWLVDPETATGTIHYIMPPGFGDDYQLWNEATGWHKGACMVYAKETPLFTGWTSDYCITETPEQPQICEFRHEELFDMPIELHLNTSMPELPPFLVKPETTTTTTTPRPTTTTPPPTEPPSDNEHCLVGNERIPAGKTWMDNKGSIVRCEKGEFQGEVVLHGCAINEEGEFMEVGETMMLEGHKIICITDPADPTRTTFDEIEPPTPAPQQGCPGRNGVFHPTGSGAWREGDFEYKCLNNDNGEPTFVVHRCIMKVASKLGGFIEMPIDAGRVRENHTDKKLYYCARTNATEGPYPVYSVVEFLEEDVCGKGVNSYWKEDNVWKKCAFVDGEFLILDMACVTTIGDRERTILSGKRHSELGKSYECVQVAKDQLELRQV